MAKPSPRPVTVAEAKQRLRDTADRVGIENSIRQNPFLSLLLAFAAGIVLADKRVNHLLIHSLIKYVSAANR